jgi:hypothetical protein
MRGAAPASTVEVTGLPQWKEAEMPRSINSAMLAALIVASALLVPAAQAQPIDPPIQTAPVQSAQVQHGLTSTYTTDASGAGASGGVASSQGTSDGFSWGDAGIGAGAVLALIGLGTGAFLGLGRSRARRSRPVPAG